MDCTVEDVEADIVHPNDRGHAYAARFITERLAAIRQELPPDDRLSPIPALPQPLLGDLFEHVVLWEAEALKPVKNEGWILDAKSQCWKSNLPGRRIEFVIEGSVILVMDWHIRDAMGKAKVQVDDRPGEVRDAWFDQTPARYVARPILNDRTIYAEPGAWDLLTGKPFPFTLQRSYGCGIPAGSRNLLIFRSATLGYIDLTGARQTENYGGIRPGCWVNAIPAGGLLLMADAASWCTCSYLNQATIALQPSIR